MNSERALLVIDMQQVAFDVRITPPVVNGPALLDTIAKLLTACRGANVSIAYLQTKAISGQPYAEDTHGWEIHPEVAPLDDENIFHKVGPSAFENPGVDEYLKARNVSEVIVCGIWSEGCVAFTCESALDHGYNVCLIADGHTTVRETEAAASEVVQTQNERFRQAGARVVAADAAIA